MIKKIIPISLIGDEKYPFAIYTTILSALENMGSNSFYKIYCLLTDKVKEEDKGNLKLLQEKYSEKCTIDIIEMEKDEYEENYFHKRISNASRYKFLLGELLPQYEKVLYLDFDILVRGDLSELYETDISEYDLAGVFSYNRYLYRKKYLKRIDIPNMNTYINTGVMLINLNRLREKEFQEKVNHYLGTFDDLVDQHIFNKICYGYIKLVVPKYNIYYSDYKRYKKCLCEINYTKAQILEAINNPVIFHYAGETKPWIYYGLPFSKEWLKYYKLSPYGKNKLKRKSIKTYELNKFRKKIINRIINKFRKKISILLEKEIDLRITSETSIERISKVISNIPRIFSIKLKDSGDMLSNANIFSIIDILSTQKRAINIETKIDNVTKENLERLKDYRIKKIEIEVLKKEAVLSKEYLAKVKYIEKNIKNAEFYHEGSYNKDIKRYLGKRLQRKEQKYTNDSKQDSTFCKQIYLKQLVCLSDGSLYPCQYTIKEENKMGDLSKEKMSEIYKKYKNKIPNFLECKNCKCANKVKLLKLKNTVVKLSNDILYRL